MSRFRPKIRSFSSLCLSSHSITSLPIQTRNEGFFQNQTITSTNDNKKSIKSGNQGEVKDPKRHKNNNIYQSIDVFEAAEPPPIPPDTSTPPKTSLNTSKQKLTLEAQNKEGVEMLNNNTKNLTLADSNKEGAPLDPTEQPTMPKSLQDKLNKEKQLQEKENQRLLKKAQLTQQIALQKQLMIAKKEHLEKERKEAKECFQNMEAKLQYLNIAEARIIDQIRKGERATVDPEADLRPATTEELTELCKDIPSDMFPIFQDDDGTLKFKDADLPHNNNMQKNQDKPLKNETDTNTTPYVGIRNETSNFWTTGILEPGIWEPDPYTKVQADTSNIIKEADKYSSDPKEIRAYQDYQFSLLPDVSKIISESGKLYHGYYQNKKGKLCHRSDPDKLIPVTRAEALRVAYL